jgi:hypothetical protein
MRSKTTKALPLVLSAGLLTVGAPLFAEYVPPPSGPYQSSVVITSKSTSEQSDGQVYRFPPADLTLEPEPDESVVNMVVPPRDNPAVDPAGRPMSYPDYAASPRGLQTAPNTQLTQPVYPSLAPNNEQGPWSVDPGYSAGMAPGQYYQQPQGGGYYPYSTPGGYPYANPYYYQDYQGTRYDTNSPFGTMPSPWSMMRDNPFFSE